MLVVMLDVGLMVVVVAVVVVVVVRVQYAVAFVVCCRVLSV